MYTSFISATEYEKEVLQVRGMPRCFRQTISGSYPINKLFSDCKLDLETKERLNWRLICETYFPGNQECIKLRKDLKHNSKIFQSENSFSQNPQGNVLLSRSYTS